MVFERREYQTEAAPIDFYLSTPTIPLINLYFAWICACCDWGTQVSLEACVGGP